MLRSFYYRAREQQTIRLIRSRRTHRAATRRPPFVLIYAPHSVFLLPHGYGHYLFPDALRRYFLTAGLVGAAFFAPIDWRMAGATGLFLAFLLPLSLFWLFADPVLVNAKLPRHLCKWYKGVPLLSWDVPTGLPETLFKLFELCLCCRPWRKSALSWADDGWAHALLVAGITDFFRDAEEPRWFSRGFGNWVIRYCSPVWGSYLVLLLALYIPEINRLQLAGLCILWAIFAAWFLISGTSALRRWLTMSKDHEWRLYHSRILPSALADPRLLDILHRRTTAFALAAVYSVMLTAYLALLRLIPDPGKGYPIDQSITL